MTDYERAMLRLKLLELAQLQSLIAMTALMTKNPEAQTLAEDSEKVLGQAVVFIGKLI